MITDQPGTTPETRIAWFCEHFEVDAPELEYETEEPNVGALLFSDGLVTWCVDQGVNLDWLFLGDQRALVAEYRDQEPSRRLRKEIAGIAVEMDPEVRNGLFTAVKAVVHFGVSMEEAMAVFNEVVDEHQGKSAA
ncbi:MAG: hypothetical protein AAFV74_20000 [Pseudomonadota bacterium]